MSRSPFQPGPATDHWHDGTGVENAPADLSGYQVTSEKDVASGYAGLDSGGKLAAAQLPGAAATDVETAAAVAALSAVYQPLDSDLTAIAALSTTATGRSLLAAANAAALRTILALGTASTSNTGDFDASGAATTAQAAAIAASQPLDSDLTAIAALNTTATGRSLLAAADASALRTILALGTAATTAASAYEVAGAAAAAQAASQPLDSDLTALAGLAIAADKLPYGSGSHAMSLTDLTTYARTLLALSSKAAVQSELGIAATFVGCRIYNSAAQNMSTTFTAVTFNSEEIDTSGTFHSTSSNTSRITVPTTGYYRFTFEGYWNTIASTAQICTFYVNGSERAIHARRRNDVINGNDPLLTKTTIMSLTANDYVEVFIGVGSGTPELGTSGYETSFECQFLGT